MSDGAVTWDEPLPPIRLRRTRRIRRRPVGRALVLLGGVVAAGWVLAERSGLLDGRPSVPVASLARPDPPARVPAPGSSIVMARDVAAPLTVVYSGLFDPIPMGGRAIAMSESQPLGGAFSVASAVAAVAPADLPLPAGLDVPAAVAALTPAAPADVAAATPADSADDDNAEATAVPLPPIAPSPVVASVPLPIPRPDLGPVRQAEAPARPAEAGPVRQAEALPPFRPTSRRGSRARGPAAPVVAADNRNFLQKLFGLSEQNGPALAYASPQAGAMGDLRSVTRNAAVSPEGGTAVYNIAEHTVYMPDGSRLEAHSGLGSRLDDPRFVHQRNVGATPPTTYELTPREALFHGVRALRLTPVGGGGVYGRVGLLAHTFMLGPNGDSNGCVSFRNFNAFRQAFDNGQVRRLKVVTGS